MGSNTSGYDLGGRRHAETAASRRLSMVGALLALLISAAGVVPAAAERVDHLPLIGGSAVAFLPGGAHLVVEVRPSTETASIRVLIGGGKLDDPRDRRGLAELHASFLARGTKDRTSTDLARAAESLGGRLESFASSRSETIALDVPAENVDPALRLVAEILQRPRLDPADLEKEKRLLAGTLEASMDDPSSFLSDDVMRALFPGHPLSSLVRLDASDVRAVTIEDVRRFHSQHLDPRRIALVVVGNCDARRVLEVASDLFGRTRDRPSLDGPAEWSPIPPLAPDALPRPAPLLDDVLRRVRRRTTQPEIMIALPIPGISDEDAPAYSLMRQILGGFQERLSTEIREKRGYAYWLQLEGSALPTAGWLGVHTGARKKNLADIERIVRAELDRIAREPASAEELERARRYLTTAEARLDATNAGRASVLAAALVEGRPLRTYEKRIARLAAVTPDRIQELARRLFEGKHLAIVTLH